MQAPRIGYMTRLPTEPVGGIATTWRHVRLLVEAGYRAVAVLPADHPRERCPVPAISESEVAASDCLVFPEAWRARMLRFRDFPGKKLVFCQNHFLIEHALLGEASYAAFGVQGAFACSGVVAAALRGRCGYTEVPVVPCGVDANLFRPGTKQPLVAYMPRKRPYEVRHIVGRFMWRYPEHEQFKFAEIDRCPSARVAEILGTSSIFLSTNHLEGLGLPPLEAMAAGCLVVGYHGEGGREYATTENGLWVEEGQIERCIEELARAAAIVAGKPDELNGYLEAGRRTAARFTPEVERQALLSYWEAQMPAARQ